nr:Uncharacterised protein [Raoultella sp. NCTC 9187]
MIQFSFGEVGLLIAAKRHVELTAQVVATQSVVAMAIQIQEQHRTTKRVLALIEFSPELVVSLRHVILRRKHLLRRGNIIIRLRFDDVVKANQIAVDVREDITRKVGIKKYRPGAHKGLNQTVALRQMFFYIVKQGVFPPRPFQKSAILFHAA